MPPQHYRTIDSGIKLASLAATPHVHDVDNLDKMLTQELNRLVTHERPVTAINGGNMGHILSIIFQSFNYTPSQAYSLQVPLGKIEYRDQAMDQRYHDTPPETLIPLYDVASKRWNFPLPTSNTVDPSLRCLTDSETGGQRKHSVEHIFASFLNTLRFALLSSAGSGHMSLSTWHATFSTNAMIGDIQRKPDLVLSDTPSAAWNDVKVCAELTSCAYAPAERIGKELDTRAFLMIRKQPWRRFVFLLSFTNHYQELRAHIYDRSGGVVSPPFDIHQNPDALIRISSCIVYGKPTCVGFDHTVTFFLPGPSRTSRQLKKHCGCNTRGVGPGSVSNLARPAPSYPQERKPCLAASDPVLSSSYEKKNSDDIIAPLFVNSVVDEVVDPTQDTDTDTPMQDSTYHSIGTIRVKDTVYDIVKIIFSSQGLVGRGTICYLVRRNDEEFIIKDHWVLGDDGYVKNEMKMLEKMKGIPGVPQLVDSWIVETEVGDPDRTSAYRYTKLPSTQNSYRTHVRLVLKPCARPLHLFNSRREFVQTLRDVVSIQEQAVSQRRVLHRDCSLFNIMIEDHAGGSRGTLIDWEFAVDIASDDQYNIGGTGTIPFMSRRLLAQVSALKPMGTRSGSQSRKSASSSLPADPQRVVQNHRDDLESLFYVFLWVCVKYRGPCGMERELDSDRTWLPLQWTRPPMESSMAKVFFLSPPLHSAGKERIDEEYSDYFRPLIPLAKEWYDLIVTRFSPTSVDSLRLSPNLVREDFRLVAEMLDKCLATLPKEQPGEYVKTKMELEEAGRVLNSMGSQVSKKRVNGVLSQTTEPILPSKRIKMA